MFRKHPPARENDLQFVKLPVSNLMQEIFLRGERLCLNRKWKEFSGGIPIKKKERKKHVPLPFLNGILFYKHTPR